MKITKPKQDDQISKFVALVNKGTECWTQAGILLVSMIDEDTEVFEKILIASSELKLHHLQTFDRIGRKQLHPSLLLNNSLAYRKVSVMPYTEQVKAMEGPISVISNGEVKQKPIHELTIIESKVAFADDHIRTLEEQRVVANTMQKSNDSTHDLRYVIEGDKIVFMAKCTFTAAQLDEILTRLKYASLRGLETSMKANQVPTVAEQI